MKVKFKDLLVGCGSSIFAAVSFVIISCVMITFGSFSIILATLFELIMQTKMKVRAMWALTGRIENLRINLAFSLPKLKIVIRDLRLF